MCLTRTLVKSFLPRRPKRAHKGIFGRVLIVAGSANMTGAGVLSARAVLQSGAGLVCLALPKSCQVVAAAAVPESLTLGLPEKNGVISERAVSVTEKFIKEFQPSVLLIGPGLAKSPFIIPFLKRNKLPAVIDADALNALAREKNFEQILHKFRVICTPHPGEMERLLKYKINSDQTVRVQAAQQLSKHTQGVSVLKGFETVITDGKITYINPTGSTALAKAGSGDVLAGIIAGLWAQLGVAEGYYDAATALKAAAAGVYLHGLCGDLAARQLSDRAVLASDVAAQLPGAWKRVLRAR